MLSFAARSSKVKAWAAGLVLQTAACTIAPEPPPTPHAVVQLSASYDRPTASLDEFIAKQLFDESVPNYTELKTLAGLSFVRGAIARALKTPHIDQAALGLDVDVQGSLTVHVKCPGWEPKTESPESETGYVDLVIGVEDSRVQRAFAGSVTACRFTANLAGQHAKVQASMQLEVDLGRSLALGDPVPPILLSASQLTAALLVQLSPDLGDGLWMVLSEELAPDGLKLDLDSGRQPLSVRIAGEDLVETLLDLERLDLGTNGTILLGLHDDGSFNLRGRDSAWNCGGDGSTACVRSD